MNLVNEGSDLIHIIIVPLIAAFGWLMKKTIDKFNSTLSDTEVRELVTDKLSPVSHKVDTIEKRLDRIEDKIDTLIDIHLNGKK